MIALALLLASCGEATGSELVYDDGWHAKWSDNASLIIIETYATYCAKDYDKLEYIVILHACNGGQYGYDAHIRTTNGEEQRTTHYYNVSFAIEFKEGEEE